MVDNPLIAPILEILKNSTQKVGEYEIIQQLEEKGFKFFEIHDSYEIRVFKKHFLTMNALYQLQHTLHEDGYYLSISALHIHIEPIDTENHLSGIAEAHEQKVRDYYLDWSHFYNSTQESVQNLIQNFWKQYIANDKRQYAYAKLNLKENSSWKSIQAQYRKLAGQYHPDRGGSPAEFIEIREAYEILKQNHQK